MLYMLGAIVALMRIFRGHRIGALAGMLNAWWIAPVGVVAPLVALAIVLLAPQMPDMFAGMTDGTPGDGWWRLGRGLGFASGVLGLASWYWTRAALNAEAQGDDRAAPYDPVLPAGAAQPLSPFWTWFQAGYRQAPRWAVLPAALLAGSPPLLVWVHPELERYPNYAATALSLLIFAVTVLPFTIGRRATKTAALFPLGLWIALLLMVPGGWLWWIGLALVAALLALAYLGIRRNWAPQNISQWVWRVRPIGVVAGAPLGWPVGLLVLIAAVVICLITQQWPLVVSAVAEAPPVVMVALALVVGPFAVALATLRTVAPPYGIWARAPGGVTVKRVIGVGLIVWIVFATPSWLEPIGLYKISAVQSPGRAGSLAQRSDLQGALADWREAQFKTCHFPTNAPMPVVIVATEGGGSRAALWFLSAARLLDQETRGGFGRYLFAISGVSGGSLGAVTYLEALAVDRANGGDLCAGPWLQDDKLRHFATVQVDPLAPALAGFFLDDALMRILPLRMVWHGLRDRAAMLETAFAQYWFDWWPKTETKQAQTAVTSGLIDLRYQQLSRGLAPHLFLNGTDVDSGNRLITSTVRFDPEDDVFPVAEDLLTRVNRDVPAATAVTNSARFPWISPAGRLPGRQVIDGGYFDNYGSRTADELVFAITRIASAQHWNLVPIVVVISNDADTPRGDLYQQTVSCAQPYPALTDTKMTGFNAADNRQQHQEAAAQEQKDTNTPDLDAPLLGLFSSRGAHAVDGLHVLRRRLCPEEHLIHIALPKPDPKLGQTAPMNWVLNDAAGRFILDKAPTVSFNTDQAALLRHMLDDVLSTPPDSRLAKGEPD